jgi:alpha-glucosidase
MQLLIPQMLTESLSGYTFSCPDMVGGGDWVSFLDPKNFNQDIVVRSAQIHALMPMMQFSVAPWRILDAQHLAAVKKAVATRAKFTPQILELAQRSAKTGELIISPLEYYFPNQGLDGIKDQFMLGANILVAPVIGPPNRRTVILPKGKWVSDEGRTYTGGKIYTIDVPLDRLPYFTLTR